MKKEIKVKLLSKTYHPKDRFTSLTIPDADGTIFQNIDYYEPIKVSLDIPEKKVEVTEERLRALLNGTHSSYESHIEYIIEQLFN